MTIKNCTANEKLKAETYFILNEDSTSSKFNDWFVNEMTIRSNSKIIQSTIETITNDKKIISIKIDSGLSENYCIEHENEVLKIIANSESTAQWLAFQLIESLSKEDDRFRAEDLPPAIVDFKTHCVTFDFEYREPFLPTNLKEGNTKVFGTNSVDEDWGLWGHNLSKVLNVNSETSAFINNSKNENQLCFSSSELFQQFSEYIIDHFGDGTQNSYRFMIMPNDNDLVCECGLCQKEGNTKNNASPAVTAFIVKLAKKFPEHWFFTSAYRTTKNPPEGTLPSHSGVFISTIDLPQGVGLSGNNKNTEIFKNQLKKWKKATDQLYVWDYISNFDDYLTPIPILYGLKERLKFFKDLEIKGVFLNGSGYDYSTFEDMKTYVAANLMLNIHCDIDNLIKSYFSKMYGSNATFISEYYLQIEKDFIAKNIPIEIYGGMKENSTSYFDAKHFKNYSNKLFKINDNREIFAQLKTVAAFTRLQIAYFEPTAEYFKVEKEKRLLPNKNIKEFLSRLEKYRSFSNMKIYREEEGYLESYISFWNEEILDENLTNLIINQPIANIQGFSSDTKVLTDGLPGNKNDYHQGWYISTTDMTLEWKSTVSGKRVLKLKFLKDQRHGFTKPEKIEIKINDKNISLSLKKEKSEKICEYSFPLDLEKGDTVKLNLEIGTEPKNKIALDEIQIL